MKFFTNEEVDLLLSKDIDSDSIKKLNTTLLWYKKKVSSINITISGQDIFNLPNLSVLISENFSMFGVPYSKVLREITINKLSLFSSSTAPIQKLFAYRTLSQVPSKAFFSGTMYHYLLLYKDSMCIYNLDNYYRVLEFINVPLNNIISFTKSTFLYNDITYFYEIIKYTDNLKESLIYLRVIDDKTSIPLLNSNLGKLVLTPISKSSQKDLENALPKRIFYKKILITVLMFLLIISLYISKL